MPPSLWRGRDPSEGFRKASHLERMRASFVGGFRSRTGTNSRAQVARLPFWLPGHPIPMGTDMNDEKVDLLCDDCGQTFSDFLNEMAEQNAKVTTCPKCGKIHDFASKAAKPGAGARSIKKAI